MSELADECNFEFLYPFVYTKGFIGNKSRIFGDEHFFILIAENYFTQISLESENVFMAWVFCLEFHTMCDEKHGIVLDFKDFEAKILEVFEKDKYLADKYYLSDLKDAFVDILNTDILINRGKILDKSKDFYEINLELLFKNMFEQEILDLIPFLSRIQSEEFYQEDVIDNAGLIGIMVVDKKNFFDKERRSSIRQKAYYDKDIDFYIIGLEPLKSEKQQRQFIENLQKLRTAIENGEKIFIRTERNYMNEKLDLMAYDLMMEQVDEAIKNGTDIPFIKDKEKIQEAISLDNPKERSRLIREALYSREEILKRNLIDFK